MILAFANTIYSCLRREITDGDNYRVVFVATEMIYLSGRIADISRIPYSDSVVRHLAERFELEYD